jgi:plastocyanin
VSVGDDCNSFGTLPVAEYNHTDGCSITGVGVYRGTESTSLDGIYFTSDFCSGKVWGLAQGEDEQWNLAELLDTELLVTGSGEDEAGELYLTACNCQYGRDYDPLDNPGGTVWRIVASDQVPEGAETVDAATQSEGANEEADTETSDAGASSPITGSTELTSTAGISGTADITGTETTTSTSGTGTGETSTGSEASGTETTANAEGEERIINVIARSMDYVPGTEEPIQVQQGEPVRFVVESPDIYHTFTVATDETKETVLFNLDVFPGTDPAEIVWTFDEPGRYYLYCIPHEALGMTGWIEVTE